MAQETIETKKVTTPKFRASFAHVFKPHGFKDQEKKYQLTMLFPKKTTDMAPLKKAVRAAAIEKWGENEKKWPKPLRFPFRDGDEKSEMEGYEGHWYIRASSNKKPGLVDKDVQPIIDEEEFYSGCFARASLIAFAYDHKGNRGVSFSLQNVQKMGDGEPFSGRKKAEDEFDAVDDGSDSKENYNTQDQESDDDMGL